MFYHTTYIKIIILLLLIKLLFDSRLLDMRIYYYQLGSAIYHLKSNMHS